MAGRPLEGKVRRRGNSWVVAVPEQRGSSRRVTRSFGDDAEGAERYSVACIAALDAGRPLPDAASFRTVRAKESPAVSDNFADVAWAWWREMYGDNTESEPERSEGVESNLRLHVIPYFDTRVDSVNDVTRAMVVGFLDHLAGKVSGPAPAPPGTGPLPERFYAIQEVADLAGKHRSTVRRAYQDGKFPNAKRETKRGAKVTIRIPTGDVLAAGFGPKRDNTASPFGYSKAYAAELLSNLRSILRYARTTRLMTFDPTEGLLARKPNPQARTNRPEKSVKPWLFDLAQSKQIAAHLHIHHQVPFWLIRGLGLRISEAFGIHLNDIYESRGRLIVDIHRQGGKKFKVNVDGVVTVVNEKDILKSDAANRTLPIPAPLADYLTTYIEAFHAERACDDDVPLVVAPRGAGQSGFRAALKQAIAANGLAYENVGFHASSHHFRKCFSTEVGWSNRVAEPVRSKFLGHQLRGFDGGADVTATDYTLDMRDVAELLVVAEVMEKLMTDQVGQLLEPTAATGLFPSGFPTSPAYRQALEAYEGAGLLAQASRDEEPVVSTHEAAELLGRSPQTIRAMVCRGALDAQPTREVHGMPRLAITVASVETLMKREVGFKRADVLAKELGINRRALRLLSERAGALPERIERNREHVYNTEMLERLYRQVERENSLRERAVSVREAADKLDVVEPTIYRFIATGLLIVDHQATQVLGLTVVTRPSLDELAARRAPRAKPEAVVGKSIPLEEVMSKLGLSRSKALALSGHGVRITRSSDWRFHVNLASLQTYLETHGPPMLESELNPR